MNTRSLFMQAMQSAIDIFDILENENDLCKQKMAQYRLKIQSLTKTVDKNRDEISRLKKQLEDCRRSDISSLIKKTSDKNTDIGSIIERVNAITDATNNLPHQNIHEHDYQHDEQGDLDDDISTNEAISDEEFLKDEEFNQNTPKLPSNDNVTRSPHQHSQLNQSPHHSSKKFTTLSNWSLHFEQCLDNNKLTKGSEKIWCLCGEQLKRPGNGDFKIDDHRSLAAFKRHCGKEQHQTYASTNNITIPS